MWVSMATVHCASYGSSLSHSDYAPAYSSPYNANSYSLGAGYAPIAAPAAYSSSSASYSAPLYAAPAKSAYGAPKYTIQSLYAHELYPGQQNYQIYHSKPTYSQIALPIVPSVPVAKLYVPAQHSYAAPAVSYGGGY